MLQMFHFADFHTCPACGR